MQARTLFEALEASARKFGEKPALHQPLPGKGKREYRTYSWVEFRDVAQEVALGLRSVGIQKGEVVALFSETRAEFYLADFGVFSNGSVSAAVYSTYPPDQVLQALQASGAKAFFVEDPKSLQRIRDAAGGEMGMPVMLLTGEAEGALGFDELRAKGRERLTENPEACRQLQEEIDPEDPAVLYLTSGATGEPKMALISHRAEVANLEMVPKVLQKFGPEDRTLAFLPSAHIAQRMAIEFLPLGLGMQVFFAESLLKLPQEIREVRPTFFLAPPRLWERIYATIRTEVGKRGALSQNIFYAAVGLGIEAAERRQAGKPLPFWLRRGLALADRLVFSKIRERFGGAMRLAVSGAAPLGRDLARFYEAVGIPLVEGYGLTEGGIVILNPLDRPKAGTIGKPLPDVEVKLSEEGELLIRSETLFSGYVNDSKATAEVLRDGWLHTGDIASIDSEGYISITGRKKEMIVLSTGKKVYPNRIESMLKTEPIINFVLLVGDRLPYITALLTVNPTAAAGLKGMNGMEGRTLEAITAADPVKAEVARAVKRVNAQLAPWEQIRKHSLLDREFTVEHGELTPTMKVRRTKALENFRQIIDSMYAGKEESH